MTARSSAMDKDRAEALANMNLTKILRAYIQQAIDEVPGYKALLVDKETIRVCSTLFGRTELAEHSLVHIEKLDTNEGLDHQELKAVCFLRPTRENVTLLKRELKRPRYQAYHLYFTNLVNQMYLQDLAEADIVKELVQQLQEFYGDFMCVDPHHFIIPCQSQALLINPKAAQATTTVSEYEIIDRLVQGLSALFLAIRRRPVIRYQKGSDLTYRLADSLYSLTYKQQYQMFDFGSRSSPVVLLLDRRDDPVTPLLSQWTYQAMVHELIGVTDNTVKLKSSKVPEASREIVLDARQDDFFRKHKYDNFGEIGLAVKQLMEKFQTSAMKHRQVETLEDMRRFVMEHSDFQSTQSNVGKHVNLMSELSELVASRNLMEVSMAEQEVANPSNNLTSTASYDDVMRLIRNLNVHDKDKVRLVILYALRFEQDHLRIRALLDYLITAGVKDREPRLVAAVEYILKYAGAEQRAGDLYGGRSLLNKAKTLMKGLQGVENVYTQHTPLLSETISQVAQNNLSPTAYPYMTTTQDEAMGWQALFKKNPPRELIIFIIGGTTYEEAKLVDDWNEKNPTLRVILGGSGVLNSDTFLQALAGGAPGSE